MDEHESEIFRNIFIFNFILTFFGICFIDLAPHPLLNKWQAARSLHIPLITRFLKKERRASRIAVFNSEIPSEIEG